MSAEETKALVLEAFDTLFNRRDYAKAAKVWSETYIQHSAHIPPGRDGLFNLVRNLPDTLRYENALILAEGDRVMLHGRPRNREAACRCLVLHLPNPIISAHPRQQLHY